MSERARALHATDWLGVFYVTGGGSELLSELLTSPGASRTVLEARVPYAFQALAELLGGPPDQACSAPTARLLAMAAFQRAQHLGSHRPFGLGCTAALATDRERRGEQRAHLAVQTTAETLSLALPLQGDRAAGERQVGDALWGLMAAGLDCPLPGIEPATTSREIIRTQARPAWVSLITGQRLRLCEGSHDGRLLLSGSFNPLHHGHQRMLAVAEARSGRAGAYELSLINPDKPALDYTSLAQRLTRFDRPVWLTRLPRFAEKARAFPGACFAVGIDTLLRIADARYYRSEHEREQAIRLFMEQDTRFIVFDRPTPEGLMTFADAELPPALRALCDPVPHSEFLDQVSSTALRRGDPSS